MLLACGGAEPEPPPATAEVPATPEPAATPEVPATACPAGMVLVPAAAEVVLGETDAARMDACGCIGGVLAAAPHTVDGFCIDRFPFPGEGKPWPTQAPAGSFTHAEAEELRDRLPALGRRYCSYAEVLLASAGPGNRRFPWGDEYEPHCEPDHRTPTRPIGGRPDCATPEGIVDLGVLTAWVTLDRRSAALLTASRDAPVSPGRLVLSGAHSATEEAFFARSNYGIHCHTGGCGVFPDEPPTGWEWIDDGLRFCADPGPGEASSELGFSAVVDAFDGDLAVLWAIPSRPAGPAAVGRRPLRRIEAGWLHTCALDDAGEAVCWGFDRDGSTRPPAGPFVDLAVGRHHACALRTSGEAVCWGSNTHGQAAPPGGRFDGLAAGEFHSCAVGDEGVVCWGLAADGQTAVPRDRGFNGLVAGDRFSCGVGGGGEVHCWGSDHAPLPSAPALPFEQVSAGGVQVCGSHRDGVDCWGSGAEAPAGSVATLSVGVGHGCGVTDAGSLTCWGADAFGQASPPAGSEWVQVSAGFTHSCAVDRAGGAACWGGDGVGQATTPSD